MSLLRKTFFGLTFSYYLRNLIFAAVVAGFQYNYQNTNIKAINVLPMALLIANTVLYPYSRFAYESLIGFFMGNNVFILPLIIMLPYKLLSIGPLPRLLSAQILPPCPCTMHLEI